MSLKIRNANERQMKCKIIIAKKIDQLNYVIIRPMNISILQNRIESFK